MILDFSLERRKLLLIDGSLLVRVDRAVRSIKTPSEPQPGTLVSVDINAGS